MIARVSAIVYQAGYSCVQNRNSFDSYTFNANSYLIEHRLSYHSCVLKYLRCKYFVDRAVCRKVLAGSEVLKMEHQLTRTVFRLSHLICVRITTDDHASRLLH